MQRDSLLCKMSPFKISQLAPVTAVGSGRAALSRPPDVSCIRFRESDPGENGSVRRPTTAVLHCIIAAIQDNETCLSERRRGSHCRSPAETIAPLCSRAGASETNSSRTRAPVISTQQVADRAWRQFRHATRHLPTCQHAGPISALLKMQLALETGVK